MDSKPSKGVAINVIETTEGRRSVAINMFDFDQMLVLTPDAARDMAYLLVRCADFINPPFVDIPNPESTAIFGPYDEEEPANLHDDDDDEDDDDDYYGYGPRI